MPINMYAGMTGDRFEQYLTEQEPERPARDSSNPLDRQVAGGHYKNKKIQPIEYIHANNLNYSEGAIVKYISRWREKNGVEDLLKIKHYVDLLIEMEAKYGSNKS